MVYLKPRFVLADLTRNLKYAYRLTWTDRKTLEL